MKYITVIITTNIFQVAYLTICCKLYLFLPLQQWLNDENAAEVHCKLGHSEKLYSGQGKYLQCNSSSAKLMLLLLPCPVTVLDTGQFDKKSNPFIKVRSILVSYFKQMRLNVNWSFDEKKLTLAKTFIKFMFFKIFFFRFLYKKIDPLMLSLICIK